MKVCFVGLGSIGSKHLINLKKLINDVTIHAYRSQNTKLAENIENLIDKQIFDSSEIDNNYDAVFVCNPSSCHKNTIDTLIDKSNYFFVEKPIFVNPVKEDELKKYKGKNFYIACPLRYNPVVKKIKEIVVQEGMPISSKIICSSYLPNWRKNDYRLNYATRREYGGGVDLDLIHEVDYMIDIFGKPFSKTSFAKKVSNLEIDSFDLVVNIFNYSTFIVEMHLDYFGRKTQRYIELFYNDKYVKGDIINNSIEFVDNLGTHIEILERSDMYIDEIKNFLDFIEGKQCIYNDIFCANNVLETAKSEEKHKL